MSKRSFGLFSLMLAGMFVLAACADPAQPTATPNTSINPTAASGQPATATAAPASTPGPTATSSAPDTAAGEASFAQFCTACHNTSDQQLVGPGLAGVGEAAASRVPGQSADDYLRTSIKSPGEFLVEGFGPIMPAIGALTDSDIENLVAYLKTLQ